MDAASVPAGDVMKEMSVKEFCEFGFLHEINRQVLHPLGLALYVNEAANGECALGGVLDRRDDPEGFFFGPDILSKEKASRVDDLLSLRQVPRLKALGYLVQPV